MLKLIRANQFKRDVKRLTKSGSKDMSKLREVIIKLVNEERLDPKYRNHSLKNNWLGFWECHIEPDWLLIYRINKIRKELELARTGSHAELF
ncbi:MAG: type II toxin-antitoxin system YafQ family toxin [Candidatus Aminicenantes bacterium]|nr:type II toxin-antitoxin system YafQ family toxin [Candidatus Aminicenantes bacterium]